MKTKIIFVGILILALATNVFAFNCGTGATCVAGQYCEDPTANSGAGLCGDCPDGTYRVAPDDDDTDDGLEDPNDDTICIPCADGSVSTGPAEQCTPCGAGEYPTDSATCGPCETGSVSAGGVATCSECGVGEVPNDDSSACEPCEAGFVSAGGVATCTQCTAGTAPNDQNSVCTPCGAGTYSAQGASECTTCAAGKSSPANSDSDSDCTACDAGKTTDGTGGACQACPDNFHGFIESQAADCYDTCATDDEVDHKKCVANYYCVKDGSDFSCEECPDDGTRAQNSADGCVAAETSSGSFLSFSLLIIALLGTLLF